LPEALRKLRARIRNISNGQVREDLCFHVGVSFIFTARRMGNEPSAARGARGADDEFARTHQMVGGYWDNVDGFADAWAVHHTPTHPVCEAMERRAGTGKAFCT